MSQDLFSPLNCNICLMLQTSNKSETEQQNDPSSITSKRQLMTCNGCHMVKYCNKSHQMIDWNIHRDFCRAIQKIKQTLKISHPMLVSGESPKCKEDIEKTILQLKYLLKNTLGRPLEFQEEELTSFPVYCPICFRIRKVNVLCMSCKNQAYCSAEHLEKHKMEHMKVCGLLQMYYTPYKTVPPENCLDLAIKTRVDSLQNLDLVQAFEQAFQCKLPDEPTISLLDYQKFAYAANFSCIFTICYALCHVDKRSYGADTKFVIFIVGASVEAVLWFQEIHCKIFFQQHPEFKELDLVFIGPDVADAPHQVLIFDTMVNISKLIFCLIVRNLFRLNLKLPKK